MKPFVLLLLTLPLAAEDKPSADSGSAVISKLNDKIAELEKQLAQQGSISQEFAGQASSCSTAFTVYRVTHPDPPKPAIAPRVSAAPEK